MGPDETFYRPLNFEQFATFIGPQTGHMKYSLKPCFACTVSIDLKGKKAQI